MFDNLEDTGQFDNFLFKLWGRPKIDSWKKKKNNGTFLILVRSGMPQCLCELHFLDVPSGQYVLLFPLLILFRHLLCIFSSFPPLNSSRVEIPNGRKI